MEINNKPAGEIKEVTKKAMEVPQVDINAPLKAPIEESTEYEGGVTPKNKLLYVFGIFGSMIVILLTIGVLVFYLTSFKGKAEEKIVKMVEQEEAAKEEVVKSFNRADITFEVLNGSGVAGAAKKAADAIEGLGYIVVTVGNTDSVEGNQLYLNTDLKKFSQEIMSDLVDFSISSVSGEIGQGSASARIIIGKR